MSFRYRWAVNPAAVLIRHTRLNPLVNGFPKAMKGAMVANEEEHTDEIWMTERMESLTSDPKYFT